MNETVYTRRDEKIRHVNSEKKLIIIDPEEKIQEIVLNAYKKELIRFGRFSGDNDIVIPYGWISRKHGEFLLKENRLFYRDVNETNGTIVDIDGYRRFYRNNKDFFELHNGTLLRIQSIDQPSRNTSVLMLYANSERTGVWKKYPLGAGDTSIGRGRNCKIVLTHPGVSRLHAIIKKQGSEFILADNNSLNGVLVNGQKIDRPRKLQEKDVIQILNASLIYTDGVVLYKSSVSGINIEVRNLNKFVGRRKKKILDQVNCKIESNEFVAIIGGSGAGKTTFMNAINGFDRKVQGEISYNGIDLRKNFNELKNLIGYVPQEDIIYENLTLRDMLYFTARIKMPGDTSKKEINARINQVLQMVELSEHQGTFIRKLSGGQKKRASIAVELLADPSVFFLDEPTSGLDPGTEQKLMITLNRLAKTQGKTIIMVTHTTQSLLLCDKVIFMGKDGRLCFCGTTEEAKEFFHTKDLVNIYNMISEDSGFWASKYSEKVSRAGQGTDEGKHDSSGTMPRSKKKLLAGQVPVLLSRYVKLIINDFLRMLLLFLQPVAIAMLLAVVANDKVFEIYEDTKSILFSLSCAAIWIGIFNSIQEICKERAILKREYMGNLKLPYYTLSKFFVQTFIGFIQAVLITVVFVICVGSPEKGILFENAFPEMMITVWLTIEASMALGFVVSAFVKSGDKAMTAAPFLLIIQLLFSGILFELKGAGEFIACATISKWSVESLGSTADLNDLTLRIQEQLPNVEHEIQEIFKHTKDNLFGNWGVLMGMTFLCAVLCTLILRKVSKDGR